MWLLPPPSRAEEIPDYQPVRDWAKLPAEIKFGPVCRGGDRFGGSGLRLPPRQEPHRGLRPGGEVSASWGDEHVKTAHGLRIDHENNVWVTDIGNHRVLKFDAEGKLLLALGKKGQPGEGPDQFDRPTDIAVAPGGDFYVSDGYGNSRVVKFSREGKFLKQWGKKGKGEGEFNLPHAICLDGKGQVYVGDRENNRIQVFDGDGKFQAQWREAAHPTVCS